MRVKPFPLGEGARAKIVRPCSSVGHLRVLYCQSGRSRSIARASTSTLAVALTSLDASRAPENYGTDPVVVPGNQAARLCLLGGGTTSFPGCADLGIVFSSPAGTVSFKETVMLAYPTGTAKLTISGAARSSPSDGLRHPVATLLRRRIEAKCDAANRRSSPHRQEMRTAERSPSAAPAASYSTDARSMYSERVAQAVSASRRLGRAENLWYRTTVALARPRFGCNPLRACQRGECRKDRGLSWHRSR